MKVCIAYFGRRYGGPSYTIELTRAISKYVDVVVILSNEIDNKEQWAAMNIPVYYIPTYSNLFTALLSVFDIKRFLIMKRIMQKEAPDIVHFTLIHPWLILVSKFVFKNCHVVYTVHDPKQHLGEENLILKITQKKMIDYSSRIIVLTEKAKKEMIGSKDLTLVDVIPHGELSYYLPQDLSLKYKPGNNNILFFGRIHKYKGLEVLVDAFKIIKNKIPDAKLHIVGDGDISNCKEKIKNLSEVEIENRWIPQEEVASFFSKAGLVVLPYIDASQSGVIPLAYSFGVPVIASDVGGLSEQIENGVSGYLVTPNNPEELADCCVELMLNDKLKMKFINEGYELVNSKLSWDNIGVMTVNAYKKALNKS